MSSIPIDDYVGRYLLTEPSGALVSRDLSRFKENGDYVSGHTREGNNVPPITGEIPGTGKFDGVNDRVIINGLSGIGRITNDFTVSFWMYYITGNVRSPFAAMGQGGSGDNEIALFIRTGGGVGNGLFLRWRVKNALADSLVLGDIFEANEWTFIALRRKGAVISEIVNTSVSVIRNDAASLVMDCPMFIGVDSDSNCVDALGGNWNGNLYDMRFYDRALSDADLARLAGGYQDPQPNSVVPRILNRVV